MKTAALLALALAMPLLAEEKAAEPPRIDLVLCLDTSNSMDGLIASAKIKLWAIVNELAKAKPTPTLRVALFSYGNDGYDRASGWVRQDCGFTGDLDALYARLDTLSTNGGTEFVARVVKAACELDWTPSAKALKLVYVAGNEPATQDPQFKVSDVFGTAIAKGIQVNTIFCGPSSNPEAAGWREAAALADGQFASIDQDHGVVTVAAPQDARLAELSRSLNGTYVAYGARGRQGLMSQSAGDDRAYEAAPAALAERVETKAGGLYRNEGWDLVDACSEGAAEPEKMKDEDLPEEMRRMTDAEKKAYVEKKAAERKAVQEEIRKLAQERKAYVAEEMRKRGEDGSKSLDAAILKALRSQAERKGIRFE